MAKTIRLREDRIDTRVAIGDDGLVAVGDEPAVPATVCADGRVRIGGEWPQTAWAAADGDARWVFIDGEAYRFEVVKDGARRKAGGHAGTLSAPMPATVVRVQVAPGDTVKRGDTLVILEAMKMELPVRAPADGVVASVNCRPGDLVQPGVSLLEME